MTTMYELEIYGPDDMRACISDFSSDTPFGAISVGDLIPHEVEGALTVTRVIHMIFGSSKTLTHKIRIDTKKA